MKKISFLSLIILTTGILFSCNDSSSSSDSITGYLDPGLSYTKFQALKKYSIAGYTCGGTAGDKSCGAVMYTGTLNTMTYFAIAVDNYLTGSSKFSLKIYWDASTATDLIPATIDSTANNPSISNVNVTATVGTAVYKTISSGSLKANIAAGTDSNGLTIYTITFTDTLTIGGAVTINNGDVIVAYKYPE